jgi:hypothetical protein
MEIDIYRLPWKGELFTHTPEYGDGYLPCPPARIGERIGRGGHPHPAAKVGSDTRAAAYWTALRAISSSPRRVLPVVAFPFAMAGGASVTTHRLSPQMWIHLLFLLFVALSVHAQNVAGFALALILLGLVGATDLVPLTDAVNAVTLMVQINPHRFHYHRHPLQLERSLRPALAVSLLGTVGGTVLATWLADAAYQVLRLRISIVFCALLLWRAVRPQQTVSSRGPSILARASRVCWVECSRRRPPAGLPRIPPTLATRAHQESLILFFGIGALLRLAIVSLSRQQSAGPDDRIRRRRNIARCSATVMALRSALPCLIARKARAG